MLREAVHPLDAIAAERSKARVADIELGLKHPAPFERHLWEQRARTWLAHLERDADEYGLLPHEEAELEAVKRLLEPEALTPPPSLGGDALLLVVGALASVPWLCLAWMHVA